MICWETFPIVYIFFLLRQSLTHYVALVGTQYVNQAGLIEVCLILCFPSALPCLARFPLFKFIFSVFINYIGLKICFLGFGIYNSIGRVLANCAWCGDVISPVWPGTTSSCVFHWSEHLRSGGRRLRNPRSSSAAY